MSAEMVPELRPTKLPARRVESSNFTVEQDGVIYRPHAGEWVEFRGDGSLDNWLSQLAQARLMQELERLNALEQRSDLDVAEAIDLSERIERTMLDTCRKIAGTIIAWNWTDNGGRPYPSVPTIDVLRSLSLDELRYLMAEGNVPDPKGIAPSTPTSPANRAQRRRKTG